MKKIYLLLFVGILFWWGCESKLDIAPKGYETNASFYNNQGDANASIIACYSQLRGVYGGHSENVLVPNSIMSDEAIPFLTGGVDRIQTWNYTFNTSNTYFQQIWSSAYRGILFSNIALDEIPKIDFDNNLKQQYLAEARFLRALHYFNLVRYFGEVPLVTGKISSLDSVFIEKSPVESINNLIEADLKFAETHLPLQYDNSDIGRATKIAALGVLSKFYLTLAGDNPGSQYWQLAESKAKEIIDLGKNDLWDQYYKVFALDSRGGKESIFEVLFNRDYGHNLFTGYAPRGAPIVPAGGYGITRVTKSLFDLFEENDQRKSVSFLTYYIHPTTNEKVTLSIDDPDPSIAISFWKLADSSATAGTNVAQTSFPYLRYSDILLVFAEARNEVKGGPDLEAYAALNKVRQRAGLEPVNNLTKEEFLEQVLLERRRELCFEGHRWFDLKRRGRLENAIREENSFNRNASFQNHHINLPIPESELDANPNLTQNAGY